MKTRMTTNAPCGWENGLRAGPDDDQYPSEDEWMILELDTLRSSPSRVSSRGDGPAAPPAVSAEKVCQRPPVRAFSRCIAPVSVHASTTLSEMHRLVQGTKRKFMNGFMCTEAEGEPVRSEENSGFQSVPSKSALRLSPHSKAVTPAKDSNPDALRVVFRGEYVPFLHDSIVKTSTGDKMLFGSELRDRRVGPAFFKWHLSNLLPEELIKTIKQKAPLDYTKLTGALVRGIRPRVDAKENPKEGEPTEHVLVLHDIVHVNEPGKRKDNVQRDVCTKYDKGKYADYKSTCLCDVENEHSGQVSLYQYLYFESQYKN